MVLDRWIICAGEDNFKIHVFDTFAQQWSQSKVELPPICGAHSCITFGSHIIFFGKTKLEAIDIKHIIPDWTYERIKHFILMRELVDKGRVIPTILFKRQRIDTSDQIHFDNEKVVQALMVNVCLDVFRNILSFLTYSKSELHTWSNYDWRNTSFAKVVKNYYSPRSDEFINEEASLSEEDEEDNDSSSDEEEDKYDYSSHK